MKPSAEPADDVPVRRADLAAGQLKPRQRSESGALLPNKQRVNFFQTVRWLNASAPCPAPAATRP